MVEARASRPIGILAALALACLPAVTVVQGARVTVIAGQGGPDYDACGSQGVLRGFDPQGDGFLAVRAGAYNGPCPSGWVYRKFVADLAG